MTRLSRRKLENALALEKVERQNVEIDLTHQKNSTKLYKDSLVTVQEQETKVLEAVLEVFGLAETYPDIETEESYQKYVPGIGWYSYRSGYYITDTRKVVDKGIDRLRDDLLKAGRANGAKKALKRLLNGVK